MNLSYVTSSYSNIHPIHLRIGITHHHDASPVELSHRVIPIGILYSETFYHSSYLEMGEQFGALLRGALRYQPLVGLSFQVRVLPPNPIFNKTETSCVIGNGGVHTIVTSGDDLRRGPDENCPLGYRKCSLLREHTSSSASKHRSRAPSEQRRKH